MSELAPASDSAPAGPPRRRFSWFWVLLAALIPAAGTLGASWIAEDTAIVGYVHRSSWWRDWVGPQYGVALVSFWRPVVSSAWGLQYELHGPDPAAFRALNLLAHAGAALLLWRLLRCLGVGELGALLGGIALGSFPEQGGTVTWISGRTDLLGALSMLATLTVAHSRRPWAALPLAFLACATKEFAFLLPGWVALLSLARGDTRRLAARRFLPVLLACLVAFGVRRLALGTWGGGYPASLPPVGEGVLGMAQAVGASWPVASLLILPICGLGYLGGTLCPRFALAGLGTWLLGLLPLYPLLADGHLEAQNERLFFVADIGFCILVAAAFARPAERSSGILAMLAFATALICVRGVAAHENAREWASASASAAQAEGAAREAVRTRAADERRALFYARFPRVHLGAYCMGFGVADRFREPFEVPSRAVWPWRTVSGFPEAERPPRAKLRDDGSLGPEDEPRVPLIEVLVEGGGPRRIVLDETLLQPDPSLAPHLLLRGAFRALGVEVVVITPSGYEAAKLGPIGPGAEHRMSLKTLFEVSNGVYSVASLLQQAADLGARRAYLELRVVDGNGAMRGVSELVELVWDEAFLEASLGESGSD